MKALRSRWFEVRLGPGGFLAFMLHRLSGIGLVVYLYLHLAVLDRLRAGPQAWDGFIALVRSPVFLALDVVLLFGLVFHGLNGLRVVALGLGRGLRLQKALFWLALFLAVGLALLGILGIPGE